MIFLEREGRAAVYEEASRHSTNHMQKVLFTPCLCSVKISGYQVDLLTVYIVHWYRMSYIYYILHNSFNQI